MSTSSEQQVPTQHAASMLPGRPSQPVVGVEQQLSGWGGRAAIGGVVSMLCAFGVVVALGLPDASDVETLTDFADIETGRVFEHVFYLAAIMLFAMHALVLQRLLRTGNPAAALFGSGFASFGFVIMAASSVLHLSTSPLADQYTSPDTSTEDLKAIEYAWYGAQSVFDTMLVTGVLLVAIGMLFFGVAMRGAPAFGSRIAWTAIVLGALGAIGTMIEIFDPGLDSSAVAVLAIVVFNLVVGLRTLKLGNDSDADVVDAEPMPVV
jgi:hypothetical protein